MIVISSCVVTNDKKDTLAPHGLMLLCIQVQIQIIVSILSPNNFCVDFDAHVFFF